MRKAAAVGLSLVFISGGVMLWRSSDESAPDGPVPSAPPVAVTPPPRVVGAWSPPLVASSLALRVSVTHDGKPVAGATVGANEQTGTSDATGNVVLQVQPGRVGLTARWEDRVVHRGLAISSLLGDQHVTLAFEDGHALELSVLDLMTAQPLQGARVEVHFDSPEPQPAMAVLTTDSAGHANLSGYKRGEFILAISRQGYESTLENIGDGDEPFVVHLQPAKAFSGRVLLPNGKPAEGATVTTLELRFEGPATATTSRDGTFTLPVTSNYLCARLGELEVGGSSEDAEEGLVLAPRVSFAGQVFAEGSDRPLEGVRVRSVFGSFETVTFTDHEGNFLIPGLCSEDPHVDFELAGYVPESVTLEPEEKNVIHLSGQGALRGLVIDEQGGGVAGASVTVRDSSISGEQVVTTDADGRFSLERVKRELSLSAVLGTRSIKQEVIVEPGQLVEVTLAISGERMHVPVEVLEDGKAASCVCTITARRIDGPAFEETTEWGYRIRHHGRGLNEWFIELPVGSYKVTASDQKVAGETEFRVQPGEVQPALRIHVVAKPPPAVHPIRVQVLSSQNVPLAGAHVTATTCGAAALTDAEGRTVCEMTGPYLQEISASRGGARAAFKMVDWSAEVVLRFEPGVTVRGHVGGELRPGLEVLVLSKEGNGKMPVSTTDFVLVDQPTIRSVVCLVAGDERLGCKVVVPDGRREVDVTIPIGAPGELRFSVVDSSGQKVLDPVLYVDRNTSWRGSTDGVVTSVVPPGEHVLVVNIDGKSERYETLFKIEPGATTDLGRVQLR